MSNIALITGASGGLGTSLAKILDDQNYSLVLVGRNRSKLEELNNGLKNKENHLIYELDMTNPQSCQLLFSELKSINTIPTNLVNCIGTIKLGAIHRMSIEDIHECLTINLFSSIYLVKYFTELLTSQKQSGACVLVSTIAAQIGTPNHEAIAASKGGIDSLCKSAAATYAPYQIRFNSVAPGLMDTPGAAKIISSPIAKEAASKQYPLGGIGTSDELAELISWLLSEKAKRVTGQTWSLDGGFTSIRPFVK